MKFIDALFYFFCKREEKDFGISAWAAIIACMFLVISLFLYYLVLFAGLINWAAFDKFIKSVSKYEFILFIALHFIVCIVYFLLNKRYKLIMNNPKIYDSPKYHMIARLWHWGAICLPLPCMAIGVYFRFGF